MKVAVITPYWKESDDILRRSSNSIRSQTYSATQFLVCDHEPKSDDFIKSLGAHHVILPLPHNDGGDTARGIGAISAINSGFDAIAFLDGDNWYYVDHIEKMVSLHERSGHDVIVARREFYRPDRTKLPLREENLHVDTNCLFLTGKALQFSYLWAVKPAPFHEIGDRLFWQSLMARGFKFTCADEPTVAYQTLWKSNYIECNEVPPSGAKDDAGHGFMKWRAENDQEEKEWWERFLFLGTIRL